MNAHLQMKSVSFGYGGHRLFTSLNLEFESGSFTVVTGPSGSGKSTLLRLLCRLEEPEQGELYYQGKPYAEWEPSKLRREVSWLQQTPALVAGTVRENLLLPFGFTVNQHMERPTDEVMQHLLEVYLLNGMTLSDDAQNLSVGQKQRICLIRALLLKPKALLLDEPVSALDPDSREVVEAKAEELSLDQGMTVLMISHQDFTPRRVSPRILDVRDGRTAFVE